MKKSTRALLGLVLIDLFLALGTLWLVLQVRSGSWHANVPQEEAISTITTTAGTAIGVVTGVLLVVWFLRRKRGE